MRKINILLVVLALIWSHSISAQVTPVDTFPINPNAASDDWGPDNYPAVANDGNGNWVTAYISDFSPTSTGEPDVLFMRASGNPSSWTGPSAATSTADWTAKDGSVAGGWPDIESDGAGNWLCVWQENYDPNLTIGDIDIFCTRSQDNGATWSQPVLVNSNGTTDVGSDEDIYPKIATNYSGNWVVVWQSWDATGSDYDIRVSRSSDNGQTWTPAALLNDYATSDSQIDSRPSITTDGLGNWVVVWESKHDLNGSSVFDFDIFFSRSTDNGATWSPAAVLWGATDGIGPNDTRPDIAIGADGLWITAWESQYFTGLTSNIAVSHSVDAGTNWTDPYLLNWRFYENYESVQPSIATDGLGKWAVIWRSQYDLRGAIGNDWDLFYTVSATNANLWTQPDIIDLTASADGNANDELPRLSTDGLGNWVVAWQANGDKFPPSFSDWDIIATNFAVSTHSADTNMNFSAQLTELLRVIQFFNIGSFSCMNGSEDGFAPGNTGDFACDPHSSDYNPQNWTIALSELLKLIQLFNIGAYEYCPGAGEGDFCPDPIPEF